MNLTIALPSLHRPSENNLTFDTPALDFFLRFGCFAAEPLSAADFYARHLWRGSLRRLLAADISLPSDTPCLPAAPVCQQMGMNQAHLTCGRLLGISEAEAAQWCGGLTEFFAADGWRFHAVRPDLWLLILPQRPDWQAVPSVWQADGQADGMERAERHAPASWLAVQTEIQMWLHAHPLNTGRAMPVNGVWLWDDSTGSAPYDWIAADASCAFLPDGGAAADLPYDWAALQTLLQEHGRPVSDGLVFLDGLSRSGDDPDARRRQIEEWETRFFAPARLALQNGSLHNLTLAADGAHGGRLTVRAKAGRAFWKRKKRFTGRLG